MSAPSLTRRSLGRSAVAAGLGLCLASVTSSPSSAAAQVAAVGVRVPNTVPMFPGSQIGFVPVSLPGYRVRHQNFVGKISPIKPRSSAVDLADSGFVVRRGLASPQGLSYESLNFPGLFLQVVDGAVVLRRNDGGPAFAATATFLERGGLSGKGTSLALFADPSRFLRHRNFVLFAEPDDGSARFRADASFLTRAGLGITGTTAALTPGSSVSIDSVGWPGYLLRHQNFAARVDPVFASSPAELRAAASYVLQRGALGAGRAFESRSFPGYFLTIGAENRLTLTEDDGSFDFGVRATFLPRVGRTGVGTSFTWYGDQNLVLRHRGFDLFAQADDATEQFAVDSTFVVRPAIG